MTAESVECVRCGATYIIASGPPGSIYASEQAVEWLKTHRCVPRGDTE